MKKKKNTYTLQEVADHYNVDKRTLFNWLIPIREDLLKMNPIKTQRLRLLTPKQVKFIRKFLG